MADACNVFCGMGILSRWEADGPYKNVDGCDTRLHFAQLVAEEVKICIRMLRALEERVVEKPGMTEVFVLKPFAFRLQVERRSSSDMCVVTFEWSFSVRKGFGWLC